MNVGCTMSMLISILKATDMENTLAMAMSMVNMDMVDMDMEMKRSMAIGTQSNMKPLLCTIDLLDLSPNIVNTRPRSLDIPKLKPLRFNPSTRKLPRFSPSIRKPINLKKRQS